MNRKRAAWNVVRSPAKCHHVVAFLLRLVADLVDGVSLFLECQLLDGITSGRDHPDHQEGVACGGEQT